MSDWMSEPWIIDPPLADKINGGFVHPIHRLNYGGWIGDIRSKPDADRIVTCVNALAGFPDPESDVQALVEALERIRDRTLRDAEPPELRAQNENNYRDAVQVLTRLRREP